MDKQDPNVRREQFVAAYVETRSVVSAALRAGIPQWMALSVGVQLISTLAIQRAIIKALPDGDADKLELALKWALDLNGDIVEPVTLAERIQAKRADLAAQKLDPQPSLITITRPASSRRKRPSRAKSRISQGAFA